MPNREKNEPAPEGAAPADLQAEDVKATAPLTEPVGGAHAGVAEEPPALIEQNPPPQAAPVETGDVRTEARTVHARNKTRTLHRLDDGTPFPSLAAKWLTEAEAARLSRHEQITIII